MNEQPSKITIQISQCTMPMVCDMCHTPRSIPLSYYVSMFIPWHSFVDHHTVNTTNSTKLRSMKEDTYDFCHVCRYTSNVTMRTYVVGVGSFPLSGALCCIRRRDSRLLSRMLVSESVESAIQECRTIEVQQRRRQNYL
jgi:hypothetical protein